MALKDDPKFIAFCKDYGPLKAFIAYLLAMNDHEAYVRTGELVKALSSQGRTKDAVLFARDVGRTKIAGDEAEGRRRELASLVLSLRKPDELKHICDQSPTGFGLPISGVITNFCKFCSKQVEE